MKTIKEEIEEENIKMDNPISNLMMSYCRMFKKEIPCFAYQNVCRIFLNEYEGQKELRENWLWKWHNDINLAKGLIELFKKWLKEDEQNPYQHFIDRFNKRN